MEGGSAGTARPKLTEQDGDVATMTASGEVDGWSLAARAEATLAAFRSHSAVPVTGDGNAPDTTDADREAELDDICEALRQTEVFANLGERRLRRLARGCTEQARPKDRMVFRYGDPSDAVFVICEGVVDVLRDQRGKPLKRLARLDAGDIFGELGVLHGVERGASVRTAEACRLLRIDKRTFQRFLEANTTTEARLEALATRRHCSNARAALDTRDDPRIRIDAPVALLPAAEKRQTTHLEDISEGGLAITGVPATWQPDLPVSFTLAAGGRRLCVIGRVAWRRGQSVGIAFTGDVPGHGQRVVRFTRALLDELG